MVSMSDQVTDVGRVRKNTAIHCQFRLVYSKLGKAAQVRFNRAKCKTTEPQTTRATSFIRLVCLVNVHNQI